MPKPKRHWGHVSSLTCLVLLFLPLPSAQAEDARFKNPRPALERLVAESRPKPRRPQHFCVVSYPQEGGYAWIHWREANRLIFWSGASDMLPDDSLVLSPRKLDLARDVVENQQQIGGSTYLVTRAWVAGRLADCQKRGKHYILPGS